MNAIKAEFRKLFSVKSTYMVVLISLAFVGFLSAYVEGYWGGSGSPAGLLEPLALKVIVGQAAGLMALAVCIISILQVGHEYRYSTITYTLTANARRTKVFLAKAFVLALFSLFIGLLSAGFAIATYRIGVSLRGAELAPQDFESSVQLVRVMAYSVVYGLFGFLVALLTRSVNFAIAIPLVLPAMVEPLLGLLVKENAKYLPISTFDHIMGVAMGQTDMTPNAAMALSALYIGAVGLIAWFLFLRRDAN